MSIGQNSESSFSQKLFITPSISRCDSSTLRRYTEIIDTPSNSGSPPSTSEKSLCVSISKIASSIIGLFGAKNKRRKVSCHATTTMTHRTILNCFTVTGQRLVPPVFDDVDPRLGLTAAKQNFCQ